ncbi:hypothetical protein F5146DRAFT_1022823 [Armillaria mellea]|nr:hypothetical protein F5146DRAFT_1022823 [Armillaria mellea]
MAGSTEACPACTLVVNLDNYEHTISSIDFSIPDNLHSYIDGNLFPTSTICTEIEQSLGRLEEQFSCFEQVFALQQNAISRVASILKSYEEAYAKTRSEQLRVQESMDRHKSALSSPIRSLPDDLLVFIFQLTSTNAAFMDQFPWVATKVCRQWRAVAHSNRTLWSEIILDPASISAPLFAVGQSSTGWGEFDHDGWNPSAGEQPGRYSRDWEGLNQQPCARCALLEGRWEQKHRKIFRPAIPQKVVRQALGYSGSIPLTFSLDFASVVHLDVFISQAARWRNVKLHLQGSLSKNLPLVKNNLPMLESLELYLKTDNILPVPTDIFVNAPSLRNLKLTLCSHDEFIFPWKQLKELSICFTCPLPAEYCLQILRNGSLLKTLRLQQKLDPWGHSASLVGGSTENSHTHSPLLDFICLPKLSSLTVCGEANRMELNLSSLIERSYSVVEKLSFSSTTVAAPFIRLLRVFPSLTSLSLRSPIRMDKAFFCAMSQKGHLPSLEDFSIHDADISYDYMMPIIDMLVARQSCLKQFHLTLTLMANDEEVDIAIDFTPGPWGRLEVTPSTSQTSRDEWLAPPEKARLRALSNEGMKIQIGLFERYSPGDPEMSYVNLGTEY